MIKSEIQLVPTPVNTKIICDSCGKKCKEKEHLELKANWGYFSNKDLQTWTAHLCETCVDTKLSFIKFQVIHY